MPPTRPGRSPSSATRPNQVYSWDITKLHGPAKWTYDLLLPLHDYRHLQPLRPRVDAGPGRTCQPGRGSHGRNHREPAHRARRAHHPLGPWITDDRPAGRPPAGRPRRHQISQPPAYEQRQPLLGKLLPDLQVPTGFPAAFGAYEDAYAHCGRFFCPLWPVLRLVQIRSPPLGPRIPHAARRPLRTGRAGPRTAGSHAPRRLRRSLRAVRQQGPHAAGTTDRTHVSRALRTVGIGSSIGNASPSRNMISHRGELLRRFPPLED